MQSRIPAVVALTLGLAACSPSPAGEPANEAPTVAESETKDAAAAALANAEDRGATVAAKDAPAKAHEEGCIHGKAGQEGCEGGVEVPTTGTGHFGAPFAGTEAKALAAAVEGAKASPNEAPTLVSGEVTAVCQAKGCWMVLQDTADATVQARVIMKNHSFAVPFDGKGKAAKVEGVLTSRTFTPAQVQHLAKDAGKDPSTVEAKPRTEWVLTATGVELVGQPAAGEAAG